MTKINLHRVHAVLLRHLMSWPRSWERMADAFWWPTFNLVIWGLVTIFLQGYAGTNVFFVNLFLGGVIMWVFVSRSQEEIGIMFLQDAWDRNLLNMFASPLTIWEFNIAAISVAFTKLIVSFVWMYILASVLFAFNIFTFGWILVPYALSLMVFGWSIALIINGLIFQYGFRVQIFAWTLIMLFQPFSAVFYPVSSMPSWMQVVAKVLPTSYIFEGMRGALISHQLDTQGLTMTFGLTLGYFVISVWFFARSFRKAQENGMIMKFS